MKIFGMLLLIFTSHATAVADKGIVIKIFSDSLVFPTNCETWADPLAAEFSLLLTCKNSVNKKYYFNFRLNNLDFTKSPIIIDVTETKLKSYTFYELIDKAPNGNLRKTAHYCTKYVCLDLVGEFDKSVKDSITSQLQES
jgi:hypothetical protein